MQKMKSLFSILAITAAIVGASSSAYAQSSPSTAAATYIDTTGVLPNYESVDCNCKCFGNTVNHYLGYNKLGDNTPFRVITSVLKGTSVADACNAVNGKECKGWNNSSEGVYELANGVYEKCVYSNPAIGRVGNP